METPNTNETSIVSTDATDLDATTETNKPSAEELEAIAQEKAEQKLERSRAGSARRRTKQSIGHAAASVALGVGAGIVAKEGGDLSAVWSAAVGLGAASYNAAMSVKNAVIAKGHAQGRLDRYYEDYNMMSSAQRAELTKFKVASGIINSPFEV